MSNALAIIPRTLAEVVDLTERLSKSTLVPKALVGKPADQLLIIMTGQEMGLAPFAAMRGLWALDGRVGMYADTMVALALSSGAAKYFRRVEESDSSVTYETLRTGEAAPRRCTWTKAMALTAGLNTKDNHRLYPKQLLASRAKAELARDVYPDVFAGVYTPEELTGGSAMISPDLPISDTAIDADFSDVPTPSASTDIEPILIAEIEAADSPDAVKALGARCNAIPKGTPQRKAVTAAYKAKLATFNAAPIAQPEAVAS